MKAFQLVSCLDKKGITYEFLGDKNVEIYGFSSIYIYRLGTITWLRNTSTLDSEDVKDVPFFSLIVTDSAVLFNERFLSQIIVNDPKNAFFSILEEYWSKKKVPSISPKAIIENGATIGKSVTIGPNAFISSETRIGDNTEIGSNVVIKGRVIIGANCIIQSGSIVGEDGFAFTRENGNLVHSPHFGGVQIGDHVQIGANVCIARGAIDDTILADYVKVDNIVHIAHNCRIGKNTVLIPGTVVMGSVKIGHDCWISTSIIREQLTIGDNVLIGMGSVVVKSIADGMTVIGNPARPLEKK